MSCTIQSARPSVMDPIPHGVHEFGIEARKAGCAWETAFNGPIQTWTDPDTGRPQYGVTVRLARIKDPETRELYSTNLLFYFTEAQMRGMHNIYDMGRELPFTRLRGPRAPGPHCPPRTGKLWYDPNPEGVIMEDVRLAPLTLPNGRPGFYVTGQGYRGKVMLPDGLFIHDVGVYGGYLDPQERPAQLELTHLFGGIEFGAQPNESEEDAFLAELGDGIWVKGIIGNTIDEVHVESFKNSVRLPSARPGKTLIGARSMSETKLLYYFESGVADGLSGFQMCGFIDGLPSALGERVWDRVHRVGLGSNFLPCPELDGWLGIIHVVLDKNNPQYPETMDSLYPNIEEQYEGWAVLLRFDADGRPVIHACVRALTPDDIPLCYEGAGELFDTKRVAFPISVYRDRDALHVAYGWGDRALFLAEFDYETVVRQLEQHAAEDR